MKMNCLEAVERLSKKYDMTMDEFLVTGSRSVLKEKKRKLQAERFDILSRYKVFTLVDLEEKIKNGEVDEHPGWEDLIELRNIDGEIKEIENDILSI